MFTFTPPDLSSYLTSVAGSALTGTSLASGIVSSSLTSVCSLSSLDVAGNITVGGTVDGRDVATDGSKLDGIDTGAKDDQTAAEIKTLLDSSGLVNSQIDASASIAGTKISPDFGSQNIITTGNITVGGTVDGIDIATDVAANTLKVTNATHTGEVTGATALTIADDVVDEANLKISNAGSDGQYLQKQSGNTGGLTWATVSGGGSAGGANTIHMNDDVKLTFGDTTTPDLEIHHVADGNSIIDCNSGDLILRSDADDLKLLAEDDILLRDNDDSTNFIHCVNGGAVKIYGFGASDPKFETTSVGANLTGTFKVLGSTNSNAYFYAQPNGTGIYAEFKGYDSAGTKKCGMMTAYGTNVYLDSNTNGTIDIRSPGTGNIAFQNNGNTTLTLDSSNNATFAGNITVSKNKPRIDLVDTTIPDQPSDYYLINDDGVFAIKDSTNDAGRLVIAPNGLVTIYGNCDFSAGIDVTGDISVTGDIKVGTAAGTANQYLKKSSSNALAWETVSPGSAGGANAITMNDSVAINFGTDSDFSISHDDTNATIDNDKGDLYITTTGSGDDIHIRAVDDVQIKVQTSENAIVCTGNGAVDLYYAAGTHSDPKFSTTASGATVTGDLGIGVSSPSRSLHISSNGTDGTQLQITGTLDSAGIKCVPSSGDTFEYQAAATGCYVAYNRTDSRADIFVDGSGNTTFAGSVDIAGAIDENVFAITDAASVALDPDNGTVQTWTLGASRTATDSVTAGQSMLLMVADGSSYTVTWPTMTWVGGSAPTLATSGYSCIELWKVGSTLYGCHVGDVA